MMMKRLAAVLRFSAMTVCLVCMYSIPASGQQPVGPGMFGGGPQCPPGTNPALFDVNFNGPTADDLPAYLEIVPADGTTAGLLVARFPTEDCFGIESRQFFTYEGTGSNPFPPGTTNTVTGVVGGWFEGDMADDNGDFVGGTFYQGANTYLVDLLPAPTGSGAYDRVEGNGGALEAVAGIQGWDLEPQDGVPDYIGLPWAGLTTFQTCDGAPDLDDTMMLWVPVVPYAAAGGPPGAVTIRFDLDCDGVPDSGYPPSPPIVPETTVPVGLQSFSIASVLPSGPSGYALAILVFVLPIGALRLARRWLSGIDI